MPCIPSARDITNSYPEAVAYSVPRNALHLAKKIKSTIVTIKMANRPNPTVQIAFLPSLFKNVTIHVQGTFNVAPF